MAAKLDKFINDMQREADKFQGIVDEMKEARTRHNL